MVSSSAQPQLNFSSTERPILSVSQLSQQLKRLVEINFQKVSIRGEISGLKYHTSGHAYFCLKDNDAVIDGVCWRGTPLGIRLEEGLEVIAHGRLTTYPGRSKYQIVVEQAEAAGEGALLKLLMERKARLEAEGLFNRKRPLPFFPKCIGVITSPTGAVIQDIIHRISDRFPCCHVLVWPVLVQGPGSSEQIANAINGFNQIKPIKPDLLIVARGGGSLEDLWSFNEEIVVRATFNSEIPIISAVGHETDTTLIDFAADLRAPTPTAAAELATPILSNLVTTVMNYGVQLRRMITHNVDHHTLKLTSLGRGLPDAWSILESAIIRLDDWQERLKKSIMQTLAQYSQQTHNIASRIPHPQYQLDVLQNQLNQMTKRFEQASVKSYTVHDQAFNMLSMRLEQSSFQRVLERGFCWVAQNDEIISSLKEFINKIEKPISLHFHDGEVEIKAEEII